MKQQHNAKNTKSFLASHKLRTIPLLSIPHNRRYEKSCDIPIAMRYYFLKQQKSVIKIDFLAALMNTDKTKEFKWNLVINVKLKNSSTAGYVKRIYPYLIIILINKTILETILIIHVTQFWTVSITFVGRFWMGPEKNKSYEHKYSQHCFWKKINVLINVPSSIDKCLRWCHVRHLDQVSKNSNNLTR